MKLAVISRHIYKMNDYRVDIAEGDSSLGLSENISKLTSKYNAILNKMQWRVLSVTESIGGI